MTMPAALSLWLETTDNAMITRHHPPIIIALITSNPTGGKEDPPRHKCIQEVEDYPGYWYGAQIFGAEEAALSCDSYIGVNSCLDAERVSSNDTIWGGRLMILFYVKPDLESNNVPKSAPGDVKVSTTVIRFV